MSSLPPDDRDTDPSPPPLEVIDVTPHDLVAPDPAQVPPVVWDIEDVIRTFAALPHEERTLRLTHLYMAGHIEDCEIRRDIEAHIAHDDRQFDFISRELAHISKCQDLIMSALEIKAPSRP